jgi:heptaprenyl diphosphate synthase
VDFGDPVFAQSVRDAVGRIEELMSTELRGGDELMTEAVVHLFEAGGKRFRPLFTVLSAQIGPRPDCWEVTVAGAVIELVHLATLYHDDVMDEAQLRRGAPSANARWGNNIAILAGDYLFATASRLVSQLGPDAVRIIAETFAELVTGQMRETKGAAAGIDPIEHYLRVVYEKTACLIAASGQFGATFSGATDDQIERLSRLGGIVGTAFQISDDIIDIDSDPDESGKLPGTDLREGAHPAGAVRAERDRPGRRPAAGAAEGPDRGRRSAGRGADAAARLQRHRQGQGHRAEIRRAGRRGTGRAARRARPPRPGLAGRLHDQPARLSAGSEPSGTTRALVSRRTSS